MQDHLRVSGIVLVPAIVERLAGPGQSYRGHQAGLIAGLDKTPGERAMIVAGRFECADDSSIITGKRRDEPIVLSTRVQNGQPTTALIRIDFNKDLVARLGDVDRYKHGIIRDRLSDGHGRSLRNEASNTFTLEILGPTMAASCGARLPLEGLRAPRLGGCSPPSQGAMALPTCRRSWPNGWTSAIWGTCVARPAIRKPRARSSVGIKRSKTASCSKTTICPATSKLKSVGSSITTTIAATTRA